MRLLVLNPNTSGIVSGRLHRLLSDGLRAGEQLRVETAETGLPYIGDAEAMAVGAQAARASLRRVLAAEEAFDAVLLGCFADLDTVGLMAMAGRPAVSLLGASVQLAARAGQRWAAITAGTGWNSLLPNMFAAAIHTYGVRGELAVVRTFEPQDPAIAGDAERMRLAIERLARLCVERDGVDVVIVGGAGLGGLAPPGVDGHPDVPVLDSVLSGLRVARELASKRPLP